MKVTVEKVVVEQVLQYLISHISTGVSYATMHKMVQGLAAGVDLKEEE